MPPRSQIQITERGDNTLLWVGLGAGALYAGYKYFLKPAVIVPKQTAAYVARVRILVPGVKLTKDSVLINLKIENPNVQPMILNAIVGDVFVGAGKNTYRLGSFNKYGPITIRPAGETTQSANIHLSGANQVNLFRYFSDLLAEKIKNQTVFFSGTVTINGRPFPVKEGFKIS